MTEHIESDAAAAFGGKKRVAAGALAVLFGWLGFHKFYLGYTLEGVIVFLLAVISQGKLVPALFILGVVEGILYLTKHDEEFRAIYLTSRKPWF